MFSIVSTRGLLILHDFIDPCGRTMGSPIQCAPVVTMQRRGCACGPDCSNRATLAWRPETPPHLPCDPPTRMPPSRLGVGLGICAHLAWCIAQGSFPRLHQMVGDARFELTTSRISLIQTSASALNAALTRISVSPSQLVPCQLFTSRILSSSQARPTPHTRSYHAPSTR